MTAPNGPILFNNSTGSDTTASGLGAANVYGTGASTTSASAVVTGIITTGVSAGDLLWVQSSSGRQFSIIASVDSSTQVTCDDVFANTESSRTWAIGGKRATLDGSDSLFDTNNSSGKTFELSLETDQNVGGLALTNGSLGVSIHVKSSVEGVKRTFMCTTAYPFRGGNWYLYDLSLKSNYSGSRFLARGDNNALDVYVRAYDCDFTDPTYNFESLQESWTNRGRMFCYRCNFKNFSDAVWNKPEHVVFHDCYFSDNNYILKSLAAGSASFKIDGCVFENNTNFIRFYRGFSDPISNCIIYGTSGVLWQQSVGLVHQSEYIKNCIFASNAGTLVGVAAQNTIQMIGCAFYNNTYIDASSGDPYSYRNITLTADPFVDAANGDFNVNADAGGGATLRATNYAINTDTSVYPFRQYVSDPFGGGAGGSTVHPLYAN